MSGSDLSPAAVVAFVDESVLRGEQVADPEHAAVAVERADYFAPRLRYGRYVAMAPGIVAAFGLLVALVGDRDPALIIVTSLGILAGAIGFLMYHLKERRVRRSRALNQALQTPE